MKNTKHSKKSHEKSREVSREKLLMRNLTSPRTSRIKTHEKH